MTKEELAIAVGNYYQKHWMEALKKTYEEIEKEIIWKKRVKDMTYEERKAYNRIKNKESRDKKRKKLLDLKLKQLREWQNIVKTAENLMKTSF